MQYYHNSTFLQQNKLRKNSSFQDGYRYSDMYTIALYWNEYEWKCIYSLKPRAFPKYTYIVPKFRIMGK